MRKRVKFFCKNTLCSDWLAREITVKLCEQSVTPWFVFNFIFIRKPTYSSEDQTNKSYWSVQMNDEVDLYSYLVDASIEEWRNFFFANKEGKPVSSLSLSLSLSLSVCLSVYWELRTVLSSPRVQSILTGCFEWLCVRSYLARHVCKLLENMVWTFQSSLFAYFYHSLSLSDKKLVKIGDRDTGRFITQLQN